MTTIVIFFVVGVLFIAAEVFLPGGIVGAIGGLVIIGGVVQAYSEFGSQGAFIAAIVAILLLVAALYLEFKVLPNTRMGSRLFLKESVKAKLGIPKLLMKWLAKFAQLSPRWVQLDSLW